MRDAAWRSAPGSRYAGRSREPRYRWFCWLGLDSEVPDQSNFFKKRHGRFRDCDLLRKLFDTAVRRCMAEGLVDGTAFAVDASLMLPMPTSCALLPGLMMSIGRAIARTRRSVRYREGPPKPRARNILVLSNQLAPPNAREKAPSRIHAAQSGAA
jgi:hypothetical protein